MTHRLRCLLVEQLGRARVEQLQMVIELSHRADRGARGTHGIGLVNRNRRWHAFDPVHCRFVHAVQELARIGREGFDIAALAFGKQRVKHQRRLAGTAGASHNCHFIGSNVQVKILEIVLACAADADGSLSHLIGAFLKRSNILGIEAGPARHVVITHAASTWQTLYERPKLVLSRRQK